MNSNNHYIDWGYPGDLAAEAIDFWCGVYILSWAKAGCVYVCAGVVECDPLDVTLITESVLITERERERRLLLSWAKAGKDSKESREATRSEGDDLEERWLGRLESSARRTIATILIVGGLYSVQLKRDVTFITELGEGRKRQQREK
jgi:hypothetical protein